MGISQINPVTTRHRGVQIGGGVRLVSWAFGEMRTWQQHNMATSLLGRPHISE